MVKRSWEEATGKPIQWRIAVVVRGLVSWGKKGYGNLPKRALHEAQKAPIFAASCELCSDLEHKLDDLNAKHEAYWYLRSRVADIKDGDRSKKYFHHKASQHKRRNFIKGIYDSSGVWQLDVERIEMEVEKYFHNIFSSNNPSQVEWGFLRKLLLTMGFEGRWVNLVIIFFHYNWQSLWFCCTY